MQRWLNNPMYSHGFLIPPLSVWLLWRRRDDLISAEKSAGKGGLALVAAALLVQWVFSAVDIKTMGAYGLIFLLWAITYYLWGGKVARIALFPIGFLVFMVPLYDPLTDTISLHLKLMVAKLTVLLLDATQLLAAVREGVMIHLPSGSLEVADPCSGIRSIIGLSAMALLLGYLQRGKLWERFAIILAAIPLAVAVNLMRVVLLCLITEAWSADIATNQSIHTFMGILVYALALVGLLSLGRMLPGGRHESGAS